MPHLNLILTLTLKPSQPFKQSSEAVRADRIVLAVQKCPHCDALKPKVVLTKIAIQSPRPHPNTDTQTTCSPTFSMPFSLFPSLAFIHMQTQPPEKTQMQHTHTHTHSQLPLQNLPPT